MNNESKTHSSRMTYFVPMAPSRPFISLIKAANTCKPQLALILGSGMGPVARRLKAEVSVSFERIPELGATTVAGHEGRLTLGQWAGKPVLVFEGRLHFYEGHSWATITRPVFLAKSLGIRNLLLTNAAGGIRPSLIPGSLMLVRDHIDWTRPRCWRFPALGCLGPERPSLYSSRLLRLLADAGRKVEVHQGVYAAVTGPNYETPAEIRALAQCGADAVGMSTAREIQAGKELGLECAAISCITNCAAGLGSAVHHKEILATAAAICEPLADLIEAFLGRL
jgi:purine-nucleoside phosphorylase